MPQLSPKDDAEILVVDRDPKVGHDLSSLLTAASYNVEWVDAREKAYNCLDSRQFDVLITELRLKDSDAMRLMRVAKERNPDICVILIAEDPDIERATEAMRQGAYDFQTKPLNMGKLEAVIERGLAYQKLMIEQSQLKRRLDERYGLTSLIGYSRKSTQAYERVREAAATDVPVILIGEDGTGKDHVAQVIHTNGARRDTPFIKYTCRPGTDDSAKSELYGVSNASRDLRREGRIERAEGGGLYIDNIGELPSSLLPDLAKVFETKRVKRLGARAAGRIDIRLFLSMSPEHANGKAISGLIDRLQANLGAIILELPPLRERSEDVAALADHFLRTSAAGATKPIEGITRQALRVLEEYPWPGNVRELQGVIEEIVVGASGPQALDVLDLPDRIRKRASNLEDIQIPGGSTMAEIERLVIEETLRACDGQREQCAEQLGIGLRTLYRKLNLYKNSNES